MRRAVAKIIPNRQSKFLAGGNDNSKSNQATNHANENHGGHSLSNHLSNLGLKMDFNSIADFYILLDNPHKSWLPGDEVSGQIILISKKNLANISITLSLVGFVKINASSHSKLRPIKHNLFHHTINIYGGNALPSSDENNEEYSNGLYKGEHRFPFIVKLPNKRVFTSIDFGKGSITYLLRAALGNTSSGGSLFKTTSNTGSALYSLSSSQGSDSNSNSPSNLINKTKSLKIINNPSYTSEKFIKLINPIDVAKLPSPKPKKLIIRDPRYAKKLSRTQSSASTINTTNTMNTYSTMSSNNSEEQANSPGLVNDTNITTPHSHHHNHHHTTEPSLTPAPATPTLEFAKPESIKVALEIPQRGYLRGELIPIKFNLSHLKKIQDVNGIIITFVRVCRLDNGPDGFFESFRKDLQQSVIPLYVDPYTFQLEINTSVRVPADAFPTISGCPLVSFQYFIEVLINLSGKSVSLDNNEHAKNSTTVKSEESAHLFDGNSATSTNSNSLSHSNLDLLNSSNSNGDFKFKFNFNVTSPINQTERSGYINTDKFKRMKKFIQITTEVIIGTHRSNEASENATLAGRVTADGDGSTAPAGSNVISSLSRHSSLLSGSNGSPNALSGSASSNSPAQVVTTVNSLPEHLARSGGSTSSQANPVPSNQNASAYINVIPEAAAVSNFETPPYFADINEQYSNAGNYGIPNYEEISDAAGTTPFPEQLNMSEKDRMKAHESSLLPSEPPLDDMIDDNDHETISPIDGTNQILENTDEEDNSTLNMRPGTSGENNVGTKQLNSNTYQFFTTPNEDYEANNGTSDDDDLYHTNLDIISENNRLGIETDTAASDYVPNYETANKDKLVLANTPKPE